MIKKTIEFNYLFTGPASYLSHTIFVGVDYVKTDNSLTFYMLMNNLIIKVGYM